MVERLKLAMASLFTFTLVPLSAAADDTNYQTYIIGQRAMGMGGAFAALADDAGGEFYNPAGTALLTGKALSISHSVYSYQRRTLSGAVGVPTADAEQQRADLTGSKIPTIPTALSIATKLGEPIDGIKRMTLGYSVFVPYRSDFSATGTAQAGDDPQALDDLRLDITETDRTLTHGLTFAMRLNRRWSVGLSAMHVYRTAETWTSGHRVSPRDENDLTDFMIRSEARLQRTVHSLVFKLGGRHDIHRNWSAGLALTSPSITLTGSGTARSTTMANDPGPNCPPTCARFRETDLSVDADSKTPLALRGGLAYTNNSRTLTVATDVSFHAPIDYDPYDIPNRDAFVPEDIAHDMPAGFAVIDRIKREPVVNVNVGVEGRIAHLLLRGGFFTNFSSAPEIGHTLFAQPSHVDMYGLSTSVGYIWDKSYIAIGALYSFGSGEVSGPMAPPPGTPATHRFGPIVERRDMIFFFIEGAGVLKQKAKAYALEKVGGSPKSEPKP